MDDFYYLANLFAERLEISLNINPWEITLSHKQYLMIICQTLKTITQGNNYFAVNKSANIAIPFPKMQWIYSLDFELSGAILLSGEQKTCSILRNAFGSNQMAFGFLITAQTVSNLADEMICDLPIAQHQKNNSMLISKMTGKKSLTKFRKLKTSKRYTLWSAETDFLRRHQIRLHAHEMGIPIFGEDLYDQISVPLLSDLKKHAKSNRKGVASPLYHSLCIHLSQVRFPWENDIITVEAPLPNKLSSMIKIMEKWS